eukprot:4900260-Pleurochrysis_carterae.AAC.1
MDRRTDERPPPLPLLVRRAGRAVGSEQGLLGRALPPRRQWRDRRAQDAGNATENSVHKNPALPNNALLSAFNPPPPRLPPSLPRPDVSIHYLSARPERGTAVPMHHVCGTSTSLSF